MTEQDAKLIDANSATSGASPQIRVGKDDCPSPHSLGNKFGRVVWGIAWLLLFRPSPRLCHGWRRLLLTCFGADIGRNVRIDPSVRIWAPWNLTLGDESAIGHHVDCYNVARITLGAHATVSQYSFLCTASHAVTDPHMRLISSPITIEDQAWVCADVFVGPGITIGTGGVAAARAVVTRDVPPWVIVAGHPATDLKRRVLSGPQEA
ncbi:MAG: putative colanic acid biosynthesis acetyltransferase [Planctomycetaceae bacterium]|nr:putative colanic acid biosynthesis acetyltransferase [Planctomycetaceae bacterium]